MSKHEHLIETMIHFWVLREDVLQQAASQDIQEAADIPEEIDSR